MHGEHSGQNKAVPSLYFSNGSPEGGRAIFRVTFVIAALPDLIAARVRCP
jgi:hypothetical protein